MPAFDLDLIGRKKPLFVKDFADAQPAMSAFFDGARILVVGGAGSIGQEVVKLLARYNVSALHVVDISENNLTELTRDFRSSSEEIFLCFNRQGAKPSELNGRE